MRVTGGSIPQFADIHEMVYAWCVMYETLHLFPVVSFITTKATEEVLFGSIRIAKNTVAALDLVSLHRHEKYCGQGCSEFDPSRFDNRNSTGHDWHTMMDGKLKIPTKGIFSPFGDGPRVYLSKSNFKEDF